MGKKDLSSITIKKERVLPTNVTGNLLKPVKKQAKERDSEMLSIKITPSEMAIILDKKEKEAGKMAPLSTYIKSYLREKTDIFKK